MARYGQTITFAIEVDEDQASRLKKWTRYHCKVGDTVRKVAARRGHPEDVKAILKKNRIHSARSVLRHRPKRKHDRRTILVPGELRKEFSLTVYSGDEGPQVTAGYAKFENVDRPERVGLTRFQGYDPVTIDLPIRWEAWLTQDEAAAHRIENEIKLLEYMAGRGDYLKGAAVGPPPVIRISSTDGQGRIVNLISDQWQWTPQSGAPLWRIAGIDWASGDSGDDRVLRTKRGNRLRQKATVTVQQHTNVRLAHRSATTRNKHKRKRKKK